MQQVSGETQSDRQRLVGSWRHIGSTVNGQPRPGQGAHPKGIIIYDAHGHMACQVAPDRVVTKAGDKPTGAEATAALDGHVAYFGTYTVDAKARTVTHHRQGSVQPGDNGDLVRAYEFVGDRLILRPAGTSVEVVWERIK
jgi:Lipocalin-like domain